MAQVSQEGLSLSNTVETLNRDILASLCKYSKSDWASLITVETLMNVVAEMEKGNTRWGSFNSLQEGYAVVEECLQQLRYEMIYIPREKWSGIVISSRALKLTAMALKLLLYVTSGINVSKRANPIE
jgi:uncharacterized membrane protein